MPISSIFASYFQRQAATNAQTSKHRYQLNAVILVKPNSIVTRFEHASLSASIPNTSFDSNRDKKNTKSNAKTQTRLCVEILIQYNTSNQTYTES